MSDTPLSFNTDGLGRVSTQVPSATTSEPVGSPFGPDILMSRFPETLYNKGVDTNLYALVNALAGDAGAAGIKHLSLAARLRGEGFGVNLSYIEALYELFDVPRLPSEVYPVDPKNSDISDLSLTKGVWDQIRVQDAAYLSRIKDYMRASRSGGSVAGMQLAMRAATGILDTFVVENYRYLFDQISDRPLGLTKYGRTSNTNEFIVVVYQSASSTLAYGTSYSGWSRPREAYNMAYYSLADLNGFTEVSARGRLTTDGVTNVTATATYIDPYLEKSMSGTLDRLSPAGTVSSINVQSDRLDTVTIGSITASSERHVISRYVTGSNNVDWPTPDPASGYFIQPGIEVEATHTAYNERAISPLYETIEGIDSYGDDALGDPSYPTPLWSSVKQRYVSDHRGRYNTVEESVYPFLRSAKTTTTARDALAIQDTPVTIVANKIKTNGRKSG